MQAFRSVFPVIIAMGLASVAMGADKKPLNIIVILADDLGWADLQCYGSDLHETPNLDAIAKKGIRFSNAYAAAPICSPTRAALLTGKHPARLGMTIWRERALHPQVDQRMLPASSIANLPQSEQTIAKLLQSAGYLTASIGKWHLGGADHQPEAHGFDINIGGTHWGAPPSYFFPYRGPFGAEKEFRFVPHLEFGLRNEYLTDRLTDEAIRVISKVEQKPFFLYLAHHAPHTPIEAKPDLIRKYEAKVTPTSRHRNPTYAAMVHSLDESVGRIVKTLESKGLAEQTMIVFTSDNGGVVGEYQGKKVTDNHPLRSGKGALYEGGVRVPLIVYCPQLIANGTVCREVAQTQDLFWTIAELTGQKVNEITDSDRDGTSLVPLFKSPEASLNRDAVFFHYPHYYLTTSPVSAVRKGDWKLLHYYEDDRDELYNLKADPGERQDVIKTNPTKATDLSSRLKKWLKETSARFPSVNPKFHSEKR